VDNNHISKEDYREYLHDTRKAQSLASWSYIGILIPLVGIILGIMSLSLSKTIPDIGKLGERVDRSRDKAHAGLALSIFVAIIWGCFTAYLVLHSPQQSQASQQTNTSQSSADTSLNTCLNNVDSWWNTNATTNGVAVDLLSNYTEQITECQTEYPVTASASYQGQYNSCISSVNQWWNSEATTVGIANLMLPVKTEMVNECAVRYPTS
jgi:hypothetical protein